MKTEEMKKVIYDFLNEASFGVVATQAGEGFAPESAVVAISVTEKLEIVFGSFSNTRKNKNIQQNQNVSVVVGWDNVNKVTIQYGGKAVKLSGEERTVSEEKHCEKNPESKKYKNNPKQEYFKVIPVWIRYSNFDFNPQVVWEVDYRDK